MKAVKMAKVTSIVKANKFHVNNISQLCQLTRRLMAPNYTTLVGASDFTRPGMAANFNIETSTSRATAKTRINMMRPPDTIPVVRLSTASPSDDDQIQKQDSSSIAPSGNCSGNPCLDLFGIRVDAADCDERLEQLLPMAWSHNPLTTLKIIVNLQTPGCHANLFRTAAFWLHKNHPKTLVSSLGSIASWSLLEDLFDILKMPLRGQDATSAAEMYERDPDYKLLHDRVSDLIAECLKSDIEKLKKHRLKQCGDINDEHDLNCSTITEEAADYLYNDYDGNFYYDNCFLDFLCESIARKIFPQESYLEAKTVRERLREEVLLPLREACRSAWTGKSFNYAGATVVDKYLEEVKAGKSEIAADAMLPHTIVGYANHWKYAQVAELQWKKMVEDMLKQGKLKNCLAVCDVNGIYGICREGIREKELSAALTVLMSELNEKPWKGKVIDFRDTLKVSKDLHLIPLRGDELRHKCDFVLRRIMGRDSTISLERVFDLILQKTVSQNLKPEQMIKKVFVFTTRPYLNDDEGSDNGWGTFYRQIQEEFMEKSYEYSDNSSWENFHEEMKIKFREKGYENAVPHIVFWAVQETRDYRLQPTISAQPGVTVVDGIGVTDYLIHLLLDNDGEINPDIVMREAISSELYKNLVVVD